MANMIVISGYLAADPEIRTTASGIMVASLRLAVRRKFAKDKDTTDFFNVEAWRGDADFAGKYFYKGKPIEIEGHLETRQKRQQARGCPHCGGTNRLFFGGQAQREQPAPS